MSTIMKTTSTSTPTIMRRWNREFAKLSKVKTVLCHQYSIAGITKATTKYPRIRTATKTNIHTIKPPLSELFLELIETSRRTVGTELYNGSPAEARGDFPIFCAAEREELDGYRRKGEGLP